MSREKQIEEMAKDLCQNGGVCCLQEWNDCHLDVGKYCHKCNTVAERLYNAGYRKQSEGEWENVYEYNAYEMRRERKTACSQCGYKPKGDIFGKTPFCPNCGAKMKGGAE